MYNPIEKERQAIISNITKGFIDNDIEKARHGVYADNAENRRLKRVGQEYGSAASHQDAQQDHSDNEGGKDLSSYASKTKTEVLQKVVDSNTASKELKDAASKELKERNGNDNTAKDSVSKQPNNKSEEHPKDNKEMSRDDDAKQAVSSLKSMSEDDDFAYKFGDYTRWGDEADIDEKELKEFENIEKYYNWRYGRQFDWKKEDKAKEYKDKQKSKGFIVVDAGGGSDTYVFLIFKKKKSKV